MSEDYKPFPPGIPEEFREEEGMLIMDDFDDCVVGVVEQFGRPPIACYDKDKVLAKLVAEGMEDYDEAYEWWSFNQIGAWMGDGTPCFITKGAEGYDALASRLAARLWECSTLRHGMFTPPEFRRLCQDLILEELVNPTPQTNEPD